MESHASESSDDEGPSADDNDDSTSSLPGMEDDVGVVWSTNLHRDFVNAIYEIGVKHASPSVLLDHMEEGTSFVQLTSERIKSRLQKYRNNKTKSQIEFLTEYDAWLQKALTVGAVASTRSGAAAAAAAADGAADDVEGARPANSLRSWSTVDDNVRDVVQLLGGDLRGGNGAACLTYAVMQEAKMEQRQAAAAAAAAAAHDDPNFYDNSKQSSAEEAKSRYTSRVYAQYLQSMSGNSAKGPGDGGGGGEGITLPFPNLTVAERQSHLGMSLTHVMALCYSLSNHVQAERQKLQALRRGSSDSRDSKRFKSEHQVSSSWHDNLGAAEMNRSLESISASDLSAVDQHAS